MQNEFKTDYQILKDNFKFIWDSNNSDKNSWEETFAKRYYDKLYKEYCIADLTFYKEGKIGLRWCNEQDLIKGKGIKICGNSSCEHVNLSPYEVNMIYEERNEKKNALVKVYMCKDCGEKLKETYKLLKKKRKRDKRKKKKDKHEKEKDKDKNR